MRRPLPAALALVFTLTQTTGAADIAAVMGPTARPALFPLPIAAKAFVPKKTVGSPRAARPRAHFWSDAAVVARWVYAQMTEQPRPVIGAARGAPRPVHVDSLAPAPEPKPSRDRLMIVKDPMIVDVAQAVRGLDFPDGDVPVYRARVEGRWLEAGPLRYRVVYKDSFGISWGDPKGFHFYVPGYRQADVAARVDEDIQGEYPVYFHGQTAQFDIELENLGPVSVEKIVVVSQQELFEPKGLGRASDDALVRTVRALKPGAKTVVHGSFYVSNGGRSRVNLEQTHVTISAGGRVLADEAHAALVDPPNLAGL